MTEKYSGRLDLFALQRELERCFDDYDQACQLGFKAAETARSVITGRVYDALRALPVTAHFGMYLFVDAASDDGLGSIRYIGCAPKQSLERRVKTYLAEDISSVDGRMSGRCLNEARRIAEERMRLTMPGTPAETRARYVDGHMRSIALTSAGTLLFARCDAPPQLIEMAEGTLICVAWAGGAKLINAKCVLPDAASRSAALALALECVEHWRSAGLPSKVADELRAGVAVLN